MLKRAVLVLTLVLLGAWTGNAATLAVPAGTVLNCKLSNSLSTATNSRGQTFAATLAEPVVVNGVAVIPAGATLSGRIADLVQAGHIKGTGKMLLVPETLALPSGDTFSLDAVLLYLNGAPGASIANAEGVIQGPRARLRELKEVGIGAGGGGLLGAAIGGVHGAVVGGVIGGTAGLVYSFRHRGPALTLPRGAGLQFELTRKLVISRSGVQVYNLSLK